MTESRVGQRRIIWLVLEVSSVLNVDVDYINRLQVDLLGSIRSSITHQLEKTFHPRVAHLVLRCVGQQHRGSLLHSEINVKLLGHTLQLVDVNAKGFTIPEIAIQFDCLPLILA